MNLPYKYMPTFRSRQQENIVLQEFDFENKMIPMVEIIKEKDRSNNPKSFSEIYNVLLGNIKAEKILVDLPVYLKDLSSMNDEVLIFNRSVLNKLNEKIILYLSFKDLKEKIIPVISSYVLKSGETDTIKRQYDMLKNEYPLIAIRTFTNTFEIDYEEIKQFEFNGILIYDMDTLAVTNPLVKKHSTMIKELATMFKISLRSAINTEVYNVQLDHGQIVAEADNSLKDLYKSTIHFDAFGDYVGVKKDDLTAGGTVSPGFIFYDPIDNLYYGFKGAKKQLSEFKDTIVPDVLSSSVVQRLKTSYPQYLKDNKGFEDIIKISTDVLDSGKSQARFKRIAMEHYLHSIMEEIKSGRLS